MNFPSHKEAATFDANKNRLLRLRVEFVTAHIPKYQRFLMEAFPWTRDIFNYSLIDFENEPEKLMLTRGKNKKVIARNF